ncbi:hypothetical protein FQN55_000864 [Onygenales sp. PD_40]|nr:hypothetical protein FQN55_000864 [Onygenales sp. PD_40]
MLSWLRGFVRSQASRICKRKGHELDEDYQQERNLRYEPCDIIWDYDLPRSINDLECLIPDIHEYFDHIVSKWMDLGSDDSGLSDYLGVHIAYHTAYIDEVWTSAFAERIRKEHRQLLFDLLATCSGMEAGPSDLLLEECRTYHQKFKWKRPDTEAVGTRVTFTVSPTGIKLINDLD